MVYATKNQLRLDLRVHERDTMQYRLNLADRNLISNTKKRDYMERRYFELSLNLNLPWPARGLKRTDLTNLETGATYWEISDYYAKYEILHSIPVPADDVVIAEGMYPTGIATKFSKYTVAINHYRRNWGTIYQCVENNEVIDQFRPTDRETCIVDISLPWQVVNIDNELRPRQWITWLYKNKTLNELAATFTRIPNK